MTQHPSALRHAPLIGLEVHDRSLWEPSRVLPLLGAMKSMGYNALVLHQNDLLDVTTQLGLTANYGVTDLRLKKVRNNAGWLRHLTAALAEFDAKLFLEIKEPSYEDYALEFYPTLIGPGGTADPTEPDWPAFCRAKVQDLLERVPDIGGLIVNLSSPESRVSLPDHLQRSGQAFDRAGWFDRMIDAFREPLKAAGKDLYVRDFSYTEEMQSDVMAAVDRQAGAVGASVKITAHDYFPEYPENPAARQIRAPFLFEFEAFGEHTGWGVIPNCRVKELRERMRGYRNLGAAGMLVRISWEAISGVTAMDHTGAVNVFALPQLARRDIDEKDLVCAWLTSSFDITDAAAVRIAELLLDSWAIPAAAYWNAQVFPRHSCIPSSWQEGWLSMQSNGMGRHDRALNIDADADLFSETAHADLFEQKKSAVDLAHRLAQAAREMADEIPDAPSRLLLSGFQWLPHFARQFELATQATFYAARGQAGDHQLCAALRDETNALADEIERSLNTHAPLPHHHILLLDPDQLRLFAKSLPRPVR